MKVLKSWIDWAMGRDTGAKTEQSRGATFIARTDQEENIPSEEEFLAAVQQRDMEGIKAMLPDFIRNKEIMHKAFTKGALIKVFYMAIDSPDPRSIATIELFLKNQYVDINTHYEDIPVLSRTCLVMKKKE